ncbi:MAG TPA: hypothetical protein VGX76_14715 [Pirellulales bacterium]|jgi:hypothetical protein|nr:hypothetical protein [Pirellulales bacterium]
MDDRPTFSLGVLFRSVSLVALIVAWPISMVRTSPDVVTGVIAGAGIILAAVVGWRRHGTIALRFTAGAWFCVQAMLISVYSGFVSSAIQSPPSLGDAIGGIVLIAIFPVFLLTLVSMLRAWT